MKVLASADLHGKAAVYDWLLHTASERRVEAMVLAGDLLGCLDGFATPEAAQEHEARLLAERLGQAPCPVFFIMGNDDLVELPAVSSHVQPLHGRRIEFQSYAFVGYQYSLPFMGGTFEKPEDGHQPRPGGARQPGEFEHRVRVPFPCAGDPGSGFQPDTHRQSGPAELPRTTPRSGSHPRTQPWRVREARTAFQRGIRRDRTRPRCGGQLRLVALLEAGAVKARILRHLGRPAEVPAAGPARAPPLASG